MTESVADLYVVLRSITDPFSRGLKTAAADAESQSKRMSSALGTVTKIGLGLGAATLGIGVASVKAATSFQTEMTKLVTQAGVAQNQMAGLTSGVLNLAGQVGFSPTSLAESLYHVESNFESMGIKSADALNLVKIAAEGAQVGGADLVDVTNALTAAVASGIPGVQNMSDAMGALNAIVGVGDMNMQQLAEAFGTGMLATVKGFGVTLDDVGAGLATFGDNNIRGAAAGTDFRMAIQALAKPVATAGSTLTKLGLTTDTLAKDMQRGGMKLALTDLIDRMNKAGITADQQGQVITDAFGRKAGTGINILVGQFDRVTSKYPKLDEGIAGFSHAWDVTKTTFGQQIKDIEAGVDSLGVRIGLWLIPQVSNLITTLQGAGSQVVSGFTGSDLKPVAHDNLHNALLNRDLATPPPLTGWQRFGEEVHNDLTTARRDIEELGSKLEPIGKDLLRFGDEAYQGLSKIVRAAEPVAHDLGVGVFAAATVAGKALANVLGPPIKWLGDFIGSHQTMFRIFADVVLSGIALKMGALGAINATKGLVDLATTIVQFPVNQTKEIGTAWDGVKVAFNGKEAKEGENAVKGLKGAVGDLKGSVSGLLDKVPALDGVRLKLAGVKDGVSGVEKAAADTSKLEKLGTDLEGVATSGTKAGGSFLEMAGSIGKTALPIAAFITGAGLLGNYLGHLSGVGRSAITDMDQFTRSLSEAAGGSGEAQAQINRLVQAINAAPFHVGASSMGDVDKALTQLVTSGHITDAQTEFDQITHALEAQNVSAQDAAAKFPGYENALKAAGDAAQTADGQVSDLQVTLSKQQALTQFQGDLSNLTQSIKDNGRSLFDNTDKARANQQAMQTAAQQIEDFYTQQRNANVPIQQATNDLQHQVDSLEQTAIQAGLYKGDVDKLLGSLNLIPSSIGTTITVDIGPAMQQIGTLTEKIDSLGVVQIAGGGGYGGGRALTNADGGPVRKGDVSWVGERGPELVVFGHDGYVVPNKALTGRQPIDPRVLSGMGLGARSTGYAPGAGADGATVVNYNITVQVPGVVGMTVRDLSNVLRADVLQYKNRNSHNGWG